MLLLLLVKLLFFVLLQFNGEIFWNMSNSSRVTAEILKKLDSLSAGVIKNDLEEYQ